MSEIENTEKEYICVRVQIVKVKKGFFRYKDEILGFSTVIPNTVKESVLLFKKIQRMFKKYGVDILNE